MLYIKQEINIKVCTIIASFCVELKFNSYSIIKLSYRYEQFKRLQIYLHLK